MLHFLYESWLSDSELSPLRLFHYVTFRAGAAGLTAFLIVLTLGPVVQNYLRKLHVHAPDHLEGVIGEELRDTRKRYIPTMGGIVIIIAVVLAIVLWTRLIPLVQIFLFTFLAFALLGFVDDWQKVRKQNQLGLSVKQKLFVQALIAFVAVYSLDQVPVTGDNVHKLMLPFLKDPVNEDISPWGILFGVIVIVSASNAVNFSDGMDGLAVGCVGICAATYGILSYFSGHKIFAEYLLIPFIPTSSEMVVIAVALSAAAIGFLWYNCHPASMFMGDTGSLSMGAAIGLMAVLVKHEILLLCIGGIFVLEATSVILQVTYFKWTKYRYGQGRRLFLCAPIHHHFQKKGWSETQTVIRFWIVSLLLAALGLASLKLR